MGLHQLKPPPGATKSRKRIGRGPGSGLGKTSGHGVKGQTARTGGYHKRGFEGGQTPLHRRLPKFGFNNARFEKHFEIVDVGALASYPAGTELDWERLAADGKVRGSRKSDGLKVLGRGELGVALKIRAHAFSEGAARKIEAAGGTVEVLPRFPAET